jgi:hypothetical protein
MMPPKALDLFPNLIHIFLLLLMRNGVSLIEGIGVLFIVFREE